MFRLITVLCASFVLAANSAHSQSSPPNSDQAKRIQMLVDRAAELVNAKGKEAFSEFRQRGSDWFSGDTYIFAYAPDGTVVLNPAFPAREGHAYHGETDKKGEGFSRRDHEDCTDKRIGMDRLLATEARTDRTVAEVELRQGCESRGDRCNWRRLLSPMSAAKVHLTQCARCMMGR
jgi:hypothetical protein